MPASDQRTARIAGLWFIGTFLFSIPALLLYDPVLNDPAAPTNAGVRRTYDRAQLERAWLRGSDGTAYVITDAKHPLPKRPAGVLAW